MELPLKTVRDRMLTICLLLVWAALFLPNVRINPNWYSDEGEVLTMSWAVAYGQPQVGPLKNDFLFPHPYPPVYLGLNGLLLRVFWYDIVVSRTLQAVTALVGALILGWVGARLRNHTFGFLCALAFLVYPETVMNFRWVRPHPLAGIFALTTIGFLIRYVQEKQLRDVVWAGLFASLTTATHYYGYPLLGAVVVTSLFVNRRHWAAAAASAATFPLVLVLWYVSSQPGGLAKMLEHLRLAGGLTTPEPFLSSLSRIYRNIVTFCLTTPVLGKDRAFVGVDWWLVVASLGIVFFPVVRFRKWFVFWLAAMMYPIFKQQDNLPIFFYPACVFLPVLALGAGGLLTQLGDWFEHWLGKGIPVARHLPAALLLGVCGLISLAGSLEHFRTKVDPWTIRSPQQAESVAAFVNANTSPGDLVLVSKNVNWLVRNARTGSLTQALAYEGQTNEMYVLPVPRELFWTECDWRQAKYVVLSSGITSAQEAIGFDFIYMRGLRGVTDLVSQMLRDGWQVAYTTGNGTATVPVGGGRTWPVAVDGEFLVLANPRFQRH